jgi:hypothetical protein
MLEQLEQGWENSDLVMDGLSFQYAIHGGGQDTRVSYRIC